MLEYYHRLDGNQFQNAWEGLLLSASVDNKGDVIGLHNQDYIQNGIILFNPLWSRICVLQLGGDLSFYTHTGHVCNRFMSNKHGLRRKDIDKKDRHNWASAQ